MRTRHLVLLFLSPILPLAGSALGLGGCSSAITLAGPNAGDGGDGGGGDGASDDASAVDGSADATTNETCALPLVPGPCKALIEQWGFDTAAGRCMRFNYGGCDGNANRFDTAAACISACGGTAPTPDVMTVDGITCTGVTQTVTKATAPDGKTWTLDLVGTCGALGLVDVFARSKDDVAYPQSCGAATAIQMSVGSEGDAGFLAYDTSYPGGTCAIASGPSTANQSTAVKLTGTIADATGTSTHTLAYTAGN
jgi:hypothetical protein